MKSPSQPPRAAKQARTITPLRAAIALVLALVAWQVYRFSYANKRDVLLNQITAANNAASSIDAALGTQFEIADRSAAAAAATLGYKLDEVSAKFRDGLSRIAETSGLLSVLVDHGEPVEAKNPVRSLAAAPSSLKSALRTSGPDFLIMRGSVRGSGTIDQALRTLALLQAQAWIHRIEGFSLRPLALRDGPQRCEVRVDVATIFNPQPSASTPGQPQIALLDERANSVINAVTARGSLRKAIPDLAAESAPALASTSQPSTPAPIAPPSNAAKWRLTGLASGRTGQHAIFTNITSGEATSVAAGTTLLDVTFLSSKGETALFAAGQDRYTLLNGQTLDARQLLPPPPPTPAPPPPTPVTPPASSQPGIPDSQSSLPTQPAQHPPPN